MNRYKRILLASGFVAVLAGFTGTTYCEWTAGDCDSVSTQTAQGWVVNTYCGNGDTTTQSGTGTFSPPSSATCYEGGGG